MFASVSYDFISNRISDKRLRFSGLFSLFQVLAVLEAAIGHLLQIMQDLILSFLTYNFIVAVGKIGPNIYGRGAYRSIFNSSFTKSCRTHHA